MDDGLLSKLGKGKAARTLLPALVPLIMVLCFRAGVNTVKAEDGIAVVEPKACDSGQTDDLLKRKIEMYPIWLKVITAYLKDLARIKRMEDFLNRYVIHI